MVQDLGDIAVIEKELNQQFVTHRRLLRNLKKTLEQKAQLPMVWPSINYN